MNLYYLGTAINYSGLFMIAGCGASLSIKSGDLNLGGEGQIYLGGFLAAVLLSKISFISPVIGLPITLIISFIGSGLIALLSALLKKYRKADFLFTSYLASAAIIPFIDGLISGPFRSKTENLLATSFIPSNYRLPLLLKPSTLNISFFLSLFCCLLFGYIIFRTTYGRKLTIYGISPDFACFCNYSDIKLTFSSAFISGGMHGICGALAICGTYYTCHVGFHTGIGWNSFSSALIAAGNPLLLIPSSLFMGFITTYSSKFALYHNYGFDLNSLIQAFILLLISFPILKKEKQK